MNPLLILNADDLGISEPVNLSIFELIDEGRITSATILANGPAFEQAIREAKKRPRAGYGVHLNASEFEPLTGPKGLEPLLNEAGEFVGGAQAIAARLDRELTGRLAREWIAQVERVRAAGIEPTHLDSHHHLHTYPNYLRSLIVVARTTGVRKLRPGQTLYRPERLHRRPLHLVKRKQYNMILRRICSARMPKGFAPYGEYVAMEHPPKLASLELMLHPGHSDPKFLREIEIVKSEWHERLLEQTRPISYREL